MSKNRYDYVRLSVEIINLNTDKGTQKQISTQKKYTAKKALKGKLRDLCLARIEESDCK